jgi:hypothetical protein
MLLTTVVNEAVVMVQQQNVGLLFVSNDVSGDIFPDTKNSFGGDFLNFI